MGVGANLKPRDFRAAAFRAGAKPVSYRLTRNWETIHQNRDRTSKQGNRTRGTGSGRSA